MLDQQAPAGDSAVWIEGLETPVAPISTITGCAIINLIKAEVARLLTEAGAPPKVLTAACHLGAERAAGSSRRPTTITGGGSESCTGRHLRPAIAAPMRTVPVPEARSAGGAGRFSFPYSPYSP